MIKKLMKSIREYKKDSLLSPAMVTLEVIMEVIIPMLMARLIDYGIQAQNLGYIWKMGILLAVTAMVSLMFGVQPLFAGHQYGVGGIYDIIGVYDAPLYEQAVMNACS